MRLHVPSDDDIRSSLLKKIENYVKREVEFEIFCSSFDNSEIFDYVGDSLIEIAAVRRRGVDGFESSSPSDRFFQFLIKFVFSLALYWDLIGNFLDIQ